jgi:hypothetical protein
VQASLPPSDTQSRGSSCARGHELGHKIAR